MAKKSQSMSVDKLLAEKLKRAQERREKRLAALRVVYGYFVSNQLTDNLLLLPKATESAHKEFLERQIALMPKHERERFKGIQIIRLGEFDKLKLYFDKSAVKVLVDCNAIFSSLKEVQNG